MIYVLDACAMTAFLTNEPGAPVVAGYIRDVNSICLAHAINMCEVYYGAYRSGGEIAAEQSLIQLDNVGVSIRTDCDATLWKEVGKLKAIWRRVSLADCFAIALTNRVDGELITSDHHELDPLAAAGVCSINFFR